VRVVAFLVCASLLAGCGGELGAPDAGGGDASADASDGEAGACISPNDAGNCRIARHALACGNAFCVSDDETCAFDPGDAGCVNQCDAGEVAAACGGGPYVSSAPPTSECRTVFATPSGLVIYCCPCAE